MEKIISRVQIKVGWWILTPDNNLLEILERLPEEPEKYGNPSIVLVSYPKNVNQKLSFDSIQNCYILNKNKNPEYFL